MQSTETKSIEIKLSHERLISLLNYDAATGVFTWRRGRGPRAPAGRVAGAVGVRGYRTIRVDQADYRAGRLAWFYVHAKWPPSLIDHINGIRDDDRIANLRPANHSQNNANAKRRSDQRAAKGVSLNSRTGKWTASVACNGRSKHLGSFDSMSAAARAYEAAAIALHGEYARTE